IGCQVLRIMGIAERIVITSMVTAKNFASVLRPSERRRNLPVSCSESAAGRPCGSLRLNGLLLGLEGEVCRCWLSRSHSNLLRLGAVSFLPGGQGVIPRRQVIDLIGSFVVADAEWSLDHYHVSAHPGMNVAFLMAVDFWRWPGCVDRRRSGWLRLIPLVIGSAWRRHRVNIVRGLIAINNLEVLVLIDRHYMRLVLTSLLFEYRIGVRTHSSARPPFAT